MCNTLVARDFRDFLREEKRQREREREREREGGGGEEGGTRDRSDGIRGRIYEPVQRVRLSVCDTRLASPARIDSPRPTKIVARRDGARHFLSLFGRMVRELWRHGVSPAVACSSSRNYFLFTRYPIPFILIASVLFIIFFLNNNFTNGVKILIYTIIIYRIIQDSILVILLYKY